MPEPVVVIFPAPEIFPVSAIVLPDGSTIPAFVVRTPEQTNDPPIVVADKLLPIVVWPDAPLLVFIFTAWVDDTAFLCPMNKVPAPFAPVPMFISAAAVRVPVPM